MKAYRELNVLFMKHQPTIPLVYRADQFYEFTEQHWQGFPTAAKPFLAAANAGRSPRDTDPLAADPRRWQVTAPTSVRPPFQC